MGATVNPTRPAGRRVQSAAAWRFVAAFVRIGSGLPVDAIGRLSLAKRPIRPMTVASNGISRRTDFGRGRPADRPPRSKDGSLPAAHGDRLPRRSTGHQRWNSGRSVGRPGTRRLRRRPLQAASCDPASASVRTSRGDSSQARRGRPDQAGNEGSCEDMPRESVPGEGRRTAPNLGSRRAAGDRVAWPAAWQLRVLSSSRHTTEAYADRPSYLPGRRSASQSVRRHPRTRSPSGAWVPLQPSSRGRNRFEASIRSRLPWTSEPASSAPTGRSPIASAIPLEVASGLFVGSSPRRRRSR